MMDAFHMANTSIKNQLQQDHDAFTWKFISLTGEAVTACGGPKIHVDCKIENTDSFDLIYVPGIYYEGEAYFQQWLHQHKSLQSWIKEHWQKETMIAANCSGTFLLAESGILNNEKASTTWWLENQFRKRYPGIKLESQKIVTFSNNIYCAGSMTSYLNLVIEIVEKEFSIALAEHVAKSMSIADKDSSQYQTPYRYLRENITREDAQVAKAQHWILGNLHKKIEVKNLALSLGISQRTLSRRFKEVLDTTPHGYIQSARIKAAELLLRESNLPISEIVEQVGYNSPSAFNEAFKQSLGITPSEYRR